MFQKKKGSGKSEPQTKTEPKGEEQQGQTVQQAQGAQQAQEAQQVSCSLAENKAAFQQIFSDCADIKMRDMFVGDQQQIACMAAYIEVTGGSAMFEKSLVGRLLNDLCRCGRQEVYRRLEQNALGLSDVTPYTSIMDAAIGMLTGDIILFVDGYDKALKIPDKGYPGTGVKDTSSEKVIRGSNEGFTESIKANTALIRKRIRSPKVKIREKILGVRSRTNVDLIYMEDLICPQVLEEIERRLEQFEIDGILDSGIVEQLSEENWYSPFPQFQTTLRPDRAAMAVLEGRIVLLSDNSPVALILPTDYNSFLKTSDDYYNRWEIASLERWLRYIASFFAMTLPGMYLVVSNFHTQILPTTLLLSFAAAREGVPFPGVVEILLMEVSFELLREAGIRMPGNLGSTIGIVGGLIIGQAAVEANLVSPIVVIVVAFTALCSFAIPNEEFATAFRLLKFFFIAMCAWLGFFGFLVGMLTVLIHLSHLTSFGIPYLMPFVAADLHEYQDERDSMVRLPLFALKRRPIYTRRGARIRYRRKK